MLPPGPFDLILADPPWSFRAYSAKGHGKSAVRHYPVMTEAELAALPVASIAAADSVLVMWTTWSQLASGLPLRIIEGWGFRASSGGAWAKTTREGLPAFGTGYVLRDASEPFLVARRGKLPPGLSRAERNLILSPRREHSRKPAEMHAMLERLLPDARRVELFAREPRPGWTVWGNETQKFSAAE